MNNKDFNNRKDFVLRNIKYSYLLSHKNKIAFYNTKKCCSSTITELIMNENKSENQLMDPTEIYKIVSYDDTTYKKVGIVRNPYKRFISGLVFMKGLLCEGMNFTKIVCPEEEVLEKYITKLLTIKQNKINPHFAPLTELIDYNDKKSIIFKLENKNKINIFLKNNGFKNDFNTIQLNKCRNIENKQKMINEFKKKPHLIEKIYQYYKKDFEIFGYDKKFPF